MKVTLIIDRFCRSTYIMVTIYTFLSLPITMCGKLFYLVFETFLFFSALTRDRAGVFLFHAARK